MFFVWLSVQIYSIFYLGLCIRYLCISGYFAGPWRWTFKYIFIIWNLEFSTYSTYVYNTMIIYTVRTTCLHVQTWSKKIPVVYTPLCILCRFAVCFNYDVFLYAINRSEMKMAPKCPGTIPGGGLVEKWTWKTRVVMSRNAQHQIHNKQSLDGGHQYGEVIARLLWSNAAITITLSTIKTDCRIQRWCILQ